MKKLFGEKRKPYKEDVSMDEWGFGDDDESYEAEAYEDNVVYDDGEVYEGDEVYKGDEEYYADGEEYYEDGEEYYTDGEEYYEDGEEYYADGEEYYADEEDYETEEGYEEDSLVYEDDEDDDDEGLGIFGGIGQSIQGMGIIDKIIAATGVVVLILALVTGGIYLSANTEEQQVSAFDNVGTQLSGITMIGENGLFAVADAVEAAIEAANQVEKEENNKNYNENDYNKDVTVVMNMTSIEKDLKLKFVNKRTKKLIGNVPFSVTVTTPDGDTEVWTDDDMDGIIYKKGIEAGGYTVLMSALEGDKYSDYAIPDSGKKVEVKEEIEYEKVDVADEIKDESEINAKEEDTAQKDTVVESELKDTVTWVESTKSTTFVSVSKDQIKSPAVASVGTSFFRIAGEMIVSGKSEMAPGETAQLTATKAADYEGWTVSNEAWQSDVAQVTVDGTGLVSASADITEAKNVTITYTCTLTENIETEGADEGTTGDGETDEESEDVSGGDSAPEADEPAEPATPAEPRTIHVTVTHQITVTPVNLVKELTVAPAKLELDLTKGVSTGELTVSIVTADDTVSKDVVWKSADEKVATVKVENGKVIVTAVAAGTTTVTATSVADDKVSGKCEVVVSGKALTAIQVDKTTASVYMGGTVQLKAITVPEECPVTWSSADETIATVDKNGLVTGVKEGVVDIIVSGVDATGEKLTAKCTVTVTKVMILNKSTLSLIVGGEDTITATFTDDGKGTLKAFSADENVVKVEVKDNKTVIFKGISPSNSVGVTIAYTTSAGQHIYQDVYLSVVSNTNKLVTTAGQQLYILTSDGKYVEAVASDYYKYDTFYVQTTRYTGWQTLNGDVFYFDVNGNYVTGEQVIQGATYNFASDGTLITGEGTLGIDVSKWNGTVDWNAVKNSGVSYVIIRCGYRGSSSGALVEDPKFKTNIKGAISAGLKVGVYFFTQATDEIEAVEEASMVLELIDDYKISYPVFLDVETSGGRGDKIDADTRTAVIKAFCETIEDSGYTAGVYANKTWLEKKMDATELTKYKIWLAQYSAQPTYTTTRVDMWQYKETGKVSGISGNVDLNLSYLGY